MSDELDPKEEYEAEIAGLGNLINELYEDYNGHNEAAKELMSDIEYYEDKLKNTTEDDFIL